MQNKEAMYPKKKRGKYDSMALGAGLGMIAPVITMVLYYELYHSYMTVEHFIEWMKLGHIYTPIISLCVLSELPVFYAFIWTKKYRSARGVLLATFIYAGLVFVLKVFT